MITGMRHNRGKLRNRNRSAFTLMEMLVVITIMLIIFSMTAGVVSLAINTDRIPSSSRTIQAALLGARDRAVRAGRSDPNQQPRRGVRFILNPKDINLSDGIPKSTTVNSLVYIGSQDDWTTGTVSVTNGSSAISGTTWTQLQNELVDIRNCRIKIPNEGAGLWYRLNSPTGTPPPYPLPTSLTRNYIGTTGAATTFRIQLPSAILPNEQPLTLDSNVVINLDISRLNNGIPPDWWDSINSEYVQGNMEIQFTPTGNVYGPLSAGGSIYLYLCSVDDVLNNRLPDDPARGEALVIKITPQTGQVQTFPVNPDNTDPFKFAKL